MNQEKKRNLSESVSARLVVSTISALIVAINLNSFVQAGDLFPGGFTGLTRLIMRCSWEFFGVELPFGPINIAINALPALFCLKYVGKRFTLWSCFVIVLTSVFTDLVPSVPITEDPLLVAVFGGLINGVSIGICLYVRITSGGTDFIAIPLMERWNVSTWNYILAGNVVMLIVAGALFGWDSALYSIIFQFASTQVVRVMDPDSTQVTVLIVTGRESAGGVCAQIQELHHTATLVEGVGLYNGDRCVLIYTVVYVGEVRKMTRMVRGADPNAFINVLRTERLAGNFYRRPRN